MPHRMARNGTTILGFALSERTVVEFDGIRGSKYWGDKIAQHSLLRQISAHAVRLAFKVPEYIQSLA